MSKLNHNWETTVIIGSGPSLTKAQVDYVYESEATVIAVNDSYKLCPWADMVFACDVKWWIHNREGISYHPNCWTLEDIGCHFNKRFDRPILNEIPYTTEFGIYSDKVHHASNSGYVAIQVARILGAKKIILIGFDHQHTDNKRHWFGDHDKKVFSKNADNVDKWVTDIDHLLLHMSDVDIVNCSLQTAITGCRRSFIENELR